MNDISTSSEKDLLGMAIRAEIDAHKIYTDMGNMVKNPLLKEKFNLLAFEENKHREIIEKLFEVMFDEKASHIPERTDESLLPSIRMSPTSSLVDILLQAMVAEKAAQDLYTSLSKRVENPQKDILSYLSKVERSHYEMLKSEYALAQEFADYAEKDIDKVIT